MGGIDTTENSVNSIKTNIRVGGNLPPPNTKESLGLFQKLSSGGVGCIFFRPLHPQDKHGVRAPPDPQDT